jgi:hypothetical protein
VQDDSPWLVFTVLVLNVSVRFVGVALQLGWFDGPEWD